MCDCSIRTCGRLKCTYSLTTPVFLLVSFICALFPWVTLKNEATRVAANDLYNVANTYEKDNPDVSTFNKFEVISSYLHGLRAESVANEVVMELAPPDDAVEEGPRLASSEDPPAPELIKGLHYAFGIWSIEFKLDIGPFQPFELADRQTGSVYKSLDVLREVDANNDFPQEYWSFWFARALWCFATIFLLVAFAIMFITRLKRYFGATLLLSLVCQLAYLATFGAAWTSATVEVRTDFSAGAKGKTAQFLQHFEFTGAFWTLVAVCVLTSLQGILATFVPRFKLDETPLFWSRAKRPPADYDLDDLEQVPKVLEPETTQAPRTPSSELADHAGRAE